MITNARCERTIKPFGVDIENPKFSWNYKAGDAHIFQKSYRITVYIGNQLCWNSGVIKIGATINVEYGGTDLESINVYSRYNI